MRSSNWIILLLISGFVVLVALWSSPAHDHQDTVSAISSLSWWKHFSRLPWSQRRLQEKKLLLHNTKEEGTTNTVAPSWQGLSLTHHRRSNEVGLPQEEFPISSVHCVGENFNQTTAWEYRSCKFTNLCYDTKQMMFITIRSSQEAELYHALSTTSTNNNGDWSSTVTISTLLSPARSAVSLRSIIPSTTTATTDSDTNSPWFPNVLDQEQAQRQYAKEDGYYMIPDNYVWIPWQRSSSSSSSSRHWIWTDWWPLFVISSLFPETTDLQMLPVIVPSAPPQQEQRQDSLDVVPKEFQKYWMHPLTIDDERMPSSSLICARHAVAGMGWYIPTWNETDSIGHGPTVRAFARHVRTTLRIPLDRNDGRDTNTNKREGAVVGMVRNKVAADLLRSEGLRGAVAGMVDISARDDFAQQILALTHTAVLIMTLDDSSCWAPLLVPDRTVVMVFFESSDMKRFIDCLYVLKNAAHLQVEWIDITSLSSSSVADPSLSSLVRIMDQVQRVLLNNDDAERTT